MRQLSKLLFTASLLGSVMATAGWASSHREAPDTAGKPRIDGTDFYMFRSYEPGREDFVTLIANYVPLQSAYGGPNYFVLDNDAVYEILIDNDGDAVEDLTFQFRFESLLAANGEGITLDIDGEDVAIPLRQVGPIVQPNDATINETERYVLSVTEGDRRSGQRRIVEGTDGARFFPKPIDNIGEKTFPAPGYASYANKHIFPIRVPGCARVGKVFVGQRAEAFAVNLGEVFDLVNFVPIDGTAFPGGIRQNRANDDLVGKHNVTSLALELPINCLTKDGNGVIGGWTTASLPRNSEANTPPTFNANAELSGSLVQRSRLGAPLVNELVIGLKDKDLFNSAEPTQDGALATYVTNPTLPALLDVLFRDAVNATLGTDIPNLAPTNFPRNDLVAAFLTGFAGLNQQETVTASEMVRLNTGVAPTPRNRQFRLGVIAGDLAGFPNGRRPGDDTVDIALRVVMGRLCYALPIGEALGLEENNVNLGLCRPRDAAVGNQPFTDGAPISARDVKNRFPYLNDPIPGSPNGPGSSSAAVQAAAAAD